MALFGKRRYYYLAPLIVQNFNTANDQIPNEVTTNEVTTNEVTTNVVTSDEVVTNQVVASEAVTDEAVSSEAVTDNEIPKVVTSTPNTINRLGLFDRFPILRRTSIGVPNGFWTGGWGGIRDWVALLTNSQLYDNSGNPVGSSQLVVQIPMNQITYVF